MQLVGRRTEIETIGAVLEEARRGRRPVVLVRGEAGIGKTAILAALLDEAERHRFDLRVGRATEMERDDALSLFRGAFELPAVDESDPESRWQQLAAAGATLDQARPVALVLDDVHWADPASRELLDLLVRRPPGGNHVVVLGVRPGETADDVLAACRSSGRPVHLLDLLPLSRDAASPLLGPHRSEADRDALYERAGGNPLLLQELGRADPTGPVPSGIVASVAQELATLGADASALARAGSLVGDPFDLDIARVVADLDLERALLAIDRLMKQGLVRGGTNLKDFRFRHPVVRSAIFEGLPSVERFAGHTRAAAALAAANRPLTEQARHLAVTVGPGDVADAATLRAAAQQLRGQAPSIAADWLLAARRARPATDLAEFSDLAELLVRSGRHAESLVVADEGLSQGQGLAIDRVRLHLAAGSVERRLGAHEAARRRLVRALDDDCLTDELAATLALCAYERGDYEEVAHWAARARSSTARLIVAASASLQAMLLRFAGDELASRAEGDVAVRAIRESTDTELAEHGDLTVAVTWALVAVERLDDALTVSRRSSAAVHAAGNLVGEVPLLVAEVLVLGLFGRTADAAVVADRAELVARLAHADQPLQWALWMRAWVHLDLGDLDTALRCARESVDLARRLDQSALVTVANAVLGSVLLAHGQAAEAVPLLAAYDVDPGWICRWSPRLVEAQLAIGDRTGARRTAAHVTALAQESGLSGTLAAAALSRALVADGVEALPHVDAAITNATAVGAGLDVAQAHLVAGRALAEVDRGRAIDHLSLAHERAASAGAHRTADAATRELRKLGRRVGRGGPRASARTGIDALSTRERELADLVATGLTNRQIAARLFLSEKTVEAHLSKAFAKVGVTGRAALAAAVAAMPVRDD